jgi:RNA polymerase sigma-70 factor (ECF subfamily)
VTGSREKTSSSEKRLRDPNPVSSVPDEELVRLARVSADAFAALYLRYIDHVFRYVYSRVGQVHDAEDIAADVFLAVLGQLEAYLDQGRFRAWLFAIARNKLADYFRHHQHPADLEEVEPAGDVRELELVVEHRIRMKRLASSISCLSPDRADAISLVVFGGLSPREVGQVLEKSENAVKMLISRAVRDLSERLDSWCSSGGET